MTDDERHDTIPCPPPTELTEEDWRLLEARWRNPPQFAMSVDTDCIAAAKTVEEVRMCKVQCD
jgi:hypothetical protein